MLGHRFVIASVLLIGCAANQGSNEGSVDMIGTASDLMTGDMASQGSLTLSSSAFQNQGMLPAEFTCDGAGVSPPLSFMNVPQAAVELELLMTTQAKDGLKWNWVLFNIPKTAAGLGRASMGVGTAGLTSDGPALAYAPPCSAGPGAKSYTFTLYAVSAKPTLPAQARDVTGMVLQNAIMGITLSKSELTVSYTRP